MGDEKKCNGGWCRRLGLHRHQCQNKAVTAAGYCKIHDPEEQKKRATKRGPSAAEQRWDRAEKARERRAAIEKSLHDSTALLRLLLTKAPRLAASLHDVAERQIERNKEALGKMQ